MSRIASTGVSAVRPRVDDRGRSRGTSRRSDGAHASTLTSIGQLRSRFQDDDGVPHTAPASLGNRPTTTGTSGVPEIRLHATADSQLGRSTVGSVDPIDTDNPERYFESTNHSQRFRRTMALFAQMDEQTRLDREQRQRMIHRSKSPTRFPVTTPNSLVISPAIGDANLIQYHSPTSLADSDRQPPAAAKSETREPRADRPRVSSVSVDNREDVARKQAAPTQTVRCSSVDCLDEEGPYEPCSLQNSAKFSSRSETDLGRSLRDEVPLPQWLTEHRENVKTKAAIFGGQVERRRTYPMENYARSVSSGSHTEEDNIPRVSVADRKPVSSGVENIPAGSSFVRQSNPERVIAPSVLSTSADVNSRSTRPVISQKPTNAVITKAVVSKTDDKYGDVVGKPGRRSPAKDDGESVLKSMEEWKSRRRISNKLDDLEPQQVQRTFDEKPSTVTLNSTSTDRDFAEEGSKTESTEPTSAESSVIFGVALRSTVQTSGDQELKSEPGADVELETKLSDAETAVRSDFLADQRHETSVPSDSLSADLLTGDIDKDVDVNATAELSDRRLSLDLAEVPHFPKDSVMLTGGHTSASPRSSSDDIHHPPLVDMKTGDHLEDSVFTKEHAITEPSDPQLNRVSLPLAGTQPENGGVDMPSMQHRLSSESSQ